MSNTGAPTSAFGNLALTGDDEDDMPVTTRSALRRQSTAVTASFNTPSSYASTRNVVAQSSISRSRQSRATTGASSIQQSRRSQVNDSDDDDEDDSSSDDERQPSFDQIKASTILQVISVFDPEQHCSPREFVIQSSASSAPEATRHTRKLAAFLAGIIKTRSELSGLVQAAGYPSGFWARQLAANMERRASIIRNSLESNLRSPSSGSGVVETIASLRSLFVEIDVIRDKYLPRMEIIDRRQFASILVTSLQWVVRNNADLYAHQPSPAFAGEGLQSERRLLSSFLSTNGQPLQFFEILRRFNGNLRHEVARLEYIYATLHGVISSTSNTPEAASRLHAVLHNVHSVLAAARSPS